MVLTHWGWDKMSAMIRTAFSDAFSWMKMYEFRLWFHWRLFLRVKLTIFQHWFRLWLGTSQWWLVYWRIYVALGLNELNQHNNASQGLPLVIITALLLTCLLIVRKSLQWNSMISALTFYVFGANQDYTPTGLSVDIFCWGSRPPPFEFPRAQSKIWRVPTLKHITNSPILWGPLGPQAKFHKGPIGFSGAWGPYL